MYNNCFKIKFEFYQTINIMIWLSMLTHPTFVPAPVDDIFISKGQTVTNHTKSHSIFKTLKKINQLCQAVMIHN